MRAVAVTDGTPRRVELPAPAARPGGLLLRVRACGLCGSDVEKLERGEAAPGGVLGHELVGEVVEGPLEPGTRVTVLHHVPCGNCRHCRSGHAPQCARYRRTRLDPGGFAELVAVPPEHTSEAVVLVGGLSDRAAALAEPLACVLRAVGTLPDGPGLVVGLGSIGLLFCMALAGKQRLYAADLRPDRLERALALGALPLDRGAAPRFAIVTAPGGLELAIAAVARAGDVVVFSSDGRVEIDLDAVYRHELTVRGMRSATPADLRRAVALIASGALDPAPLVTHELPLDAFAEGVELYRSGEALKVLFRP